MFLQTVDEWGRELLVDSVLFCYHNQPGWREGESSEGGEVRRRKNWVSVKGG